MNARVERVALLVVNSGGIDKNAAERDRHVLQEAARACGAKVDL